MKLAFQFLVYLLGRSLECAVLLTPVPLGLGIGRGVGLVVWWLARRRRRIALDNIRHAYKGQLTPREMRRLARRSLMHMGSVAAETIYIPRLISVETWQRYAVLEGYRQVLQPILAGRGAIVVTGHLGNWELGAAVMAALGFPIFAIARPPSNPFVARRVRQVRQAYGQELIDKRGALDAMEEVLQQGGVLGFLADQHAGRTGLWVDFLGRPASTHKAVALLAIRMNVPILVTYACRTGRGFRYVLRVAEAIQPADYADDPRALEHITQRYTTALGRAILDYPEQWLWAHRRWRPRGHRTRRRRSADRRTIAKTPPPKRGG